MLKRPDVAAEASLCTVFSGHLLPWSVRNRPLAPPAGPSLNPYDAVVDIVPRDGPLGRQVGQVETVGAVKAHQTTDSLTDGEERPVKGPIISYI
jgi:hypothetical protein